jgi:acyl-CoA synthetase (AMP-forming)/AMP-acid ligase II
MLSYRAITDQLDAYQQALGLKAVRDARFASWLPLYHDMGLISSFLMPIWLGIPILSVDPFEWTRRPSLIFDAIQDFRATHSWVPNFALLHHVRSVRGEQTWDLSSLRAVICCSEPNKPAAFDSFLDRFATWGVTPATLQTCYAMAETVFAVTQSPIGQPVRRLLVDRGALQTTGFVEVPLRPEDGLALLSNGPAIPGCEVRILKNDDFVSDNIVGEVCVTASFLFSGYYNNEDETDRVFRGSWLRTGDLGFLNDGDLFIVGRTKDIIIINGKNIVAHDVEAAISGLPQIKGGRAVAFGHYVESLGSEQLVVVAERLDPKDDTQATIRMISNAVSMEIGISCGDIRLVDQGWLIKTTSGKISRSENLRKYIDSFLLDN